MGDLTTTLTLLRGLMHPWVGFVALKCSVRCRSLSRVVQYRSSNHTPEQTKTSGRHRCFIDGRDTQGSQGAIVFCWLANVNLTLSGLIFAKSSAVRQKRPDAAGDQTHKYLLPLA